MVLRILLVEDNPINADLALALLESAGHVVVVATNGAAFRERLKDESPGDIVLMDITLPDVDGVSLLRELRVHTRHRDLPVIAVTAQALIGDAERLLAAGFDSVLTKPIDTRTFTASVERHAHARTHSRG